MGRVTLLTLIAAAIAALPLVAVTGQAPPPVPAPRPSPTPPTPAWPALTFTQVGTNFIHPVHVTHAGDGTGRLFIVERAGRIKTLAPGGQVALFLDISDQVLSANSEQGLLSVAFAPNYTTSGAFYVNYTRGTGAGQTVISRFRPGSGGGQSTPTPTATPTPTPPGPRVLAPPTRSIVFPTSGLVEDILLVIPQPYANHNGGQIAFGPDGLLYIGMGDGGGGGDPDGNAQNPNSRHGKLLRLDVNTPGAQPEIVAKGLRNPWRFSFDTLTGALYLGDVGQGAIEEIDYLPPGFASGINFGWPMLEGNQCYQSGCSSAGTTLPVATYSHSLGCSVTGGHVYRGAMFPALQGIYLYGDFCSGRIWGLKSPGAWQSQQLAQLNALITTFGQGQDGSLYVVSYSDGSIFRIGVQGAPPPQPASR